jgi:hypothetical protein
LQQEKKLSDRVDEQATEAFRIFSLLRALHSHAEKFREEVANCPEDHVLHETLADMAIMLDEMILPRVKTLGETLMEIPADCRRLEEDGQKGRDQA